MTKKSPYIKKKLKEWTKEFVKEEVRHGRSKKTAERHAKEVVENFLDRQLY